MSFLTVLISFFSKLYFKFVPSRALATKELCLCNSKTFDISLKEFPTEKLWESVKYLSKGKKLFLEQIVPLGPPNDHYLLRDANNIIKIGLNPYDQFKVYFMFENLGEGSTLLLSLPIFEEIFEKIKSYFSYTTKKHFINGKDTSEIVVRSNQAFTIKQLSTEINLTFTEAHNLLIRKVYIDSLVKSLQNDTKLLESFLLKLCSLYHQLSKYNPKLSDVDFLIKALVYNKCVCIDKKIIFDIKTNHAEWFSFFVSKFEQFAMDNKINRLTTFKSVNWKNKKTSISKITDLGFILSKDRNEIRCPFCYVGASVDASEEYLYSLHMKRSVFCIAKQLPIYHQSYPVKSNFLSRLEKAINTLFFY